MNTYYFTQELTALVRGMEERTILTPDGEYYKQPSIRNWQSKIATFEKYIGAGSDVPLSDINHQWYEDYRLHLMNSGYTKNSIGNILAALKAFIRRMHNAGKMAYNGHGIRACGEITTAVFTTINEIKELLSLDLSGTPGREKIRDIYVCQCFLGLRVGDMRKFLNNIKIYIKQINGIWVFEVPTNKTGEIVVIPAGNIVLEIAERRDYDFGRTFSQQYYHRELRHIIKHSGIDREIIFSRTEGGEKIERPVLFSSLVGTHTARRTFATNAYLAGVPVLDIMKITGHKSFNSFYRYIRCENTAIALRLAEHEFFNLEL